MNEQEKPKKYMTLDKLQEFCKNKTYDELPEAIQELYFKTAIILAQYGCMRTINKELMELEGSPNRKLTNDELKKDVELYLWLANQPGAMKPTLEDWEFWEKNGLVEPLGPKQDQGTTNKGE